MIKFFITAIFLTTNALADFNISHIKLSQSELVIDGESLQDITSVAIISNDYRKDFQIGNAFSNQVIAYPLDDIKVDDNKTVYLVIADSTKELNYPIAISNKQDSFTSYKLIEAQESVSTPNQETNLILENNSEINFLPGDKSTGYDYNYSIYANQAGDLAIKGLDNDLFKIDKDGNVEISGTLKIKGRPIPYCINPTNNISAPLNLGIKPKNFTAANKVVLSTGASSELAETSYTVPMNICPKDQILKSDGVNFVCSLESSEEEQLGPVYTNTKGLFTTLQLNRTLQISNVIIDAGNNISGVINFTSSGNMDVATGTFHVEAATGKVGIGTATPNVNAKLDVIGAASAGIRLKQGGPISNSAGPFSNGIVMENSADNHAVGIGYGAGDLFSVIGFNGTVYNTVFTLNGAGNGVILGNLKIGAYTLTAAAGASGTVLSSDGAGNVNWVPVAGGTVNGPGTTVVGNVASWNNTTGSLLADGNKAVANLVTNAGVSTSGYVAAFADATGKVITNGTKLEADLVTGPATASASDNLASFNGLTGKIIKDSGISSTNLVTMAAPALAGNVLSSTGGKAAADSLLSVANIPTMAAPATNTNGLILSAGSDKTVKATGYQVPSAICASGFGWRSDGNNMVCSAAPAGDVTGPATSVDNAIARFNGATGKIIQNSGVLVSDTNDVTGIATLSTSGLATLNSLQVTTNSAMTGTLNTGGLATLNSLAVTTSALITGTLGVAGQMTVNNTTGGQFTLPIGRGTLNQVLITDGAGGTSWAANPQGDVVGQGASLADNIAVYADATGKLIKDSTLPVANVLRKATNFSGAGRLALSAGANHTIQETAYTFPATDGAVNSVLRTNGAGVATWVPVPTSFGDVTGPGTSTAGAPAIFADGTGKLLAGTVPYTIPTVNGTVGQVLKMISVGVPAVTGWADAATGTGDVNGPGSSVSGNLATFSGTSGKVIQDSLIPSANVVTNSTTATLNAIARYTGAGKVVKDSPVLVDDTGKITGVTDFTSTGPMTVTGALQVNGAGTFTGALMAQSYTNTSDRALKKDITTFTGASDLIDQIVPVSFRWKEGDNRIVFGLIAQDVEKVIPNVVSRSKSKNGEIRSYDISQVLVITLQALKETRAEVKMLQEKIKKLEQKSAKGLRNKP